MRNSFLIILIFGCFMVNAQEYTLEQACKDKIVKVSVNGMSAHTGLCLRMEVVNLTDQVVKITAERGRMLISKDEEVQDMIITRELLVNLGPNDTQKQGLYAMCTQGSNAGPSVKTFFNLGQPAPTNLLKLVEVIDKLGRHNSTDQAAIWKFANNERPLKTEEVGSQHEALLYACLDKYPPQEIDRSVNFVLAGKRYLRGPEEPEPIPAREVTVIRVHKFTGGAVFALDRAGIIDVGFYAPDGTLLKSVIENQERERSFCNVKFDLTMHNPEDGEYQLRFYVDGELDQKKSFYIRNGKRSVD